MPKKKITSLKRAARIKEYQRKFLERKRREKEQVLATFIRTSELCGDKSLKMKEEDFEIVIEGNSEEDYIRVKNEDIKGANLVNHEDHESFEEFDVKYEDITVKNEDIDETNMFNYEDHGSIEEFDVKYEDVTVKNEDIQETNLINYEDHGSIEELDVKFENITVKNEDFEETNLANYEDHGSIEELEVKDIIHNHNSYINSEIREVVQRKLFFENNKIARNGSIIDRGKISPWPFYFSQSKVPEAGMGVWTNTHLPQGLLFGPFEGRIYGNVEPREKSINNWLGYANFSHSYNETNLIVFQYKGEIYCKTKMDIKQETELMIWYGDRYRNPLRYISENKSNGKILMSSKEEKREKSKLLSAPAKNSKKERFITKFITANGEIFPDNYVKAIFNNKNNIDATRPKLNFFRKVADKLADNSLCKQESKLKLDRSSKFSEVAKNNKVTVTVKSDEDCDCAFQEPVSFNHIERFGSQSPNIDPKNALRENILKRSYCKINFYSSSSSKLKFHEGKKFQKCYYCDKKISVTSNRKDNRTHTGEKPFQCNECNKKFNQLASLRNQSRFHKDENLFKCKYCDKRFSLSSLKTHIPIHTGGERPFKCNLCHKKFNSLSSLKSHHRIHAVKKHHLIRAVKRHPLIRAGEEPYKCDRCNKLFNTFGNLTRHIRRIHTDEKLFKCDHCDKVFSQSINFKQHLRIHKDKIF